MVHEAVSRTNTGGILYPQESESRDVRSLDGIWNFRISPETDPLTGFRERWFQKDLSQVSPLISFLEGGGDGGLRCCKDSSTLAKTLN
jgi:hypothetical protein